MINIPASANIASEKLLHDAGYHAKTEKTHSGSGRKVKNLVRYIGCYQSFDRITDLFHSYGMYLRVILRQAQDERESNYLQKSHQHRSW
jgi:hypothetical protein